MLRVPRFHVQLCADVKEQRRRDVVFFRQNYFMHCFNMEYHNALHEDLYCIPRELVSKDGLSFLVICASTIFWQWSGKSFENLRGLDHPQYHCYVLTRWAN